MAESLSVEFVREFFSYDRESGVLTWNQRPLSHFKDSGMWKSWNTKFSGKAVGGKKNRGYIRCVIFGKAYGAHQIVWLYVHGHWPQNIDHVDGDRSNNRIENLRSVSKAENARNRGIPANNTSGHIGVYQLNGRWRAQINCENQRKYLGSFDTLEEAVAARKSAQKDSMLHENHGRRTS
jgi:hypothetical protein